MFTYVYTYWVNIELKAFPALPEKLTLCFYTEQGLKIQSFDVSQLCQIHKAKRKPWWGQRDFWLALDRRAWSDHQLT